MPQSLQKGTPPMDSKKYIGMDVHKESISIAVMNGAGKIGMECVIETKASIILQFIDGLRGDVQVTFEEGTSAAWLYDLLKPHERTNSTRPAGILATACKQSGPYATREVPAVIAVWINWQLARDRPGRLGWRRGS